MSLNVEDFTHHPKGTTCEGCKGFVYNTVPQDGIGQVCARCHPDWPHSHHRTADSPLLQANARRSADYQQRMAEEEARA